MPRNDDMGLILTKAYINGFFPNVANEELDMLEARARDLFANDSGFGARARSYTGADKVLYQPSVTSLMKWRGIRQKVISNKQQGHIAFIGDSQDFGAAGTGASNPKYLNSHPGQLRTMLDRIYGAAGSGIVTANPNVRANPAYDPRFTFGGASFLDHGFGLYSSSAYRLNGASDATLDFTDVADEFWVHVLSSGSGTFTAQIDSQATITGSIAGSGAGGSQARETGYYNTASNSHNVFKFPTGSTASHTLKLRPSVTSGQNLFVMYVEARINGNGRFRVSNAAQSSKSLSSVVPTVGVVDSGDSTGLTGLCPVDSLKADLLVMGLGINDWQGQSALANVKFRIETMIDRQRAATNPMTGVVPANGDIVLLFKPQPDLVTLGGGNYTNPSWHAYRDLFYQIADSKDVALIDLGSRWKDYSTGNTYGMWGDTIHPNDLGSGDIAAAVYRALFIEA
jgi:lysophospholipase L1-like esterase